MPYEQPISTYNEYNPLGEMVLTLGEFIPNAQTANAAEITHKNIPVFSFPPLEKVKEAFLQSGYSAREVESIIIGLSELPEYATSKNKQTRGEKNQT